MNKKNWPQKNLTITLKWAKSFFEPATVGNVFFAFLDFRDLKSNSNKICFPNFLFGNCYLK